MEKKTCHTPAPGAKPTRIPRWKYDAVRKAILSVVPGKEPGVEFMKLPGLVEKKMKKSDLAELGSVGWHVATVKLNMEVEGELKRVPGSKPQRLIRI